MYTKKVKITWQKDSYLDCGPNDRNENDSAALAELDAKTAEMIAVGKMSADTMVESKGSSLISTRLFTDQSAAEEWISFINAFVAKYRFVKSTIAIMSA